MYPVVLLTRSSSRLTRNSVRIFGQLHTANLYFKFVLLTSPFSQADVQSHVRLQRNTSKQCARKHPRNNAEFTMMPSWSRVLDEGDSDLTSIASTCVFSHRNQQLQVSLRNVCSTKRLARDVWLMYAAVRYFSVKIEWFLISFQV